MPANKPYQYYRDAIRGRHLPALLLDLDLLEANARAMLERAGGMNIRIASKSVRSAPVLRRLLDLDPRFQGLLCYSADEAAWLAGKGFDDLVVAYPTTQADSVAAVCERVAGGASIRLMVDDVEQVRRLEEVAGRADTVLPLCLDVDMSVDFPGIHFGVHRSPVTDAASALAVYREIAASAHLRLDGVMGYEAEIAGVGDAAPGQALQNRLVRLLKRRSLAPIARRRGAVVEALRDEGARLRFVNGGGTGSLETTSRESAVTEIAAGSGFYSPLLFDYYHRFRHQPAMLFALEVVRRPGPGHVTCAGGGYVASGGGGPLGLPRPFLPEGLALEGREGAGEVQTPLRLPAGLRPDIGDPVFFRHAKAGEVCERFREILLVSDGGVRGEAATYRGEGQCFF